MATNPVNLAESDYKTALARARQTAEAAGELRPPMTGRIVSPLDPEERSAVLRLLTDGTYARAATMVGEQDPDLADQ